MASNPRYLSYEDRPPRARPAPAGRRFPGGVLWTLVYHVAIALGFFTLGWALASAWSIG